MRFYLLGKMMTGPHTETTIVEAIRAGLIGGGWIRPLGEARWRDIASHAPFAATMQTAAARDAAKRSSQTMPKVSVWAEEEPKTRRRPR